MTILIVTNRSDITSDFVVLELHRRNADYVRLNTEDVPTAVSVSWSPLNEKESFFDLPSQRLFLSSITSIWYRRPISAVPAQQITSPPARAYVINETRGVLEGIWRTLDCFWVSNPDSIRKASFKIYQLQLAKRVGFKIPASVITNIPESASEFVAEYPETVFKMVSSSRIPMGDTDGLVFTSKLDEAHKSKLSLIQYAPSFFQKFIRKEADIRVTCIGSKLFAVAIDSQETKESTIDWRRVDATSLTHRVIELPTAIVEKCLSLVSLLDLQFAAIDLVLTNEGEYYFLEINPNGQWAWLEQLTGVPLSAALADLLMSGGKAINE